MRRVWLQPGAASHTGDGRTCGAGGHITPLPASKLGFQTQATMSTLLGSRCIATTEWVGLPLSVPAVGASIKVYEPLQY